MNRIKEWRYRTWKSKIPQLSQEQKEEVITLYKNWVAISDIAKKYNRTVQGIYKLLKVNKIR